MGYSPEQKELLDAIQIMIDNTLNSQVTKIYSCIMYDIGNNKQCTILLNGQTHAVQYYGNEPTVGQQYKVFVPFNNMAQAFVITGGSAGSDPSTTNDYSQLTNKPSINSVTLSGNSTSTDLGLYGSGNEPNYPVTKVNNKTGEVSLTATDLNAVPTSRTINGKALSTNISLTSSDVGALPSSTVIPTQTSQLTNNSGFITSVQAPVQSVSGATGEVVLSASDVGALSESTTYVESVNGSSGLVTIDKTAVGLGNLDNVRQYSASNPPPYPVSSVNGQTGAVNLTIPTETSDLINDSGFITASGAPVQSVNGQTGTVSLSIPTKTSDLTNDSKFLPVTQTSPTNGQIVVFDGVKWVNQNPATYSQQQANWAETDSGSVQFIQNKPTALSQFNNDEGFISSSEAPVQSVNGATGEVTITNITGNAATATKATQDGNGSIITTTYAKLASPTFTGTPKAPTATAGTNTTQIATTAFVTSAVSSAGGNVTYLSATAPTSPKTGDTWYQIL